MATKIETTIGELPHTLSSYALDRKVSVVIEDTDEEKIEAINDMLKRSRASGTVDGETALKELRDEFLAAAQK